MVSNTRLFLQVIEREKTKGNHPNYARVIADAGIRAAQDPIQLFAPVVVGFLSVRTITRGLQIFVEDELFKSYNSLISESLSCKCITHRQIAVHCRWLQGNIVLPPN